MAANEKGPRSIEDLRHENEDLRSRLRELMETIDAIRRGEVDAIVVAEGDDHQIYTLEGADYPYRALVETIQEGALTLSPEGTILYANAAFAGMRGVPLPSVPGAALRDQFDPRDRAELDALLAASTLGPCRGEMRICSGEGSFPVQVSLTPVVMSGETAIGAVVTDRRQDYDRLRLLARMLDSVADAVTAVDSNGTIVYWNGAAERLYGWTVSEMVDRPLADRVDHGVPEDEARRIADLLAAGEVWTGEYMARHRDGRRFPVEATRAPVYDENGALVGVIATSRDITERKQAEEALQRQNEELVAAEEELRCQNEELITVEEELRVRNDDLLEIQEHLRESEAGLLQANALANRERDRVKSLLELAGVMILALDTEGRVTLINRRGCEILDRPEEEILGKNWVETFLPEAVREDLRAAFARMVTGDIGRFERNENPVLTRAGEERHILWSNRLIVGDDGEVVGILSSGEDITERKRAEEGMRESERRQAFLLALGDALRGLGDVREIAAVASEMVGRHLGASGVAYCEMDPGGRHPAVQVDWTDGTAPAPAGRGRTVIGIDDMARQSLLGRTGTANANGEPRISASFGVPIWRGGRLAAVLAVQSARPRAWSDAEIELLRDAGGRIWAATARSGFEAALRDSEERFRTLYEHSRDAIVLTDPRDNGCILAANPAACRLLGWSEGEFVGQRRDALLDVGDPHVAAMLEQRADNGAASAELVYRRRDGSTFPGEVTTALFTDSRGDLRAVSVIRDVSERKEAELGLARYADELRRSNEELQRFAYVASHDLQEPLRSVVSFSQLLERRYKGRLDQDADEYIDFIVEGGNRMQTLIQDLLQFSRIETAAKPLSPTDAGAVVNDVLRLLATPLGEADATVTVGDLPVVMADGAQLEQVFVNLVGNAIKYRREGVPPAIAITARRTGGMVEFAVRDNGIGIEEEYFDRIFEMFRRLHTHDKYDGTGIGLAVVKRIVERHGGKIRVESVPGEGSTFLFTIPAA